MAKLIKIGRVFYSDLRMGGKRIRRALSTDQRIAEGKLADLIKERNARKHHHTVQDIKWEDFKKRFYEYASTKAKDTYAAYRRAVTALERFITPHKLAQITPNLLLDLKIAWKKKERGLYVVNRDIAALKTMMRCAETWGLIHKQEWGSIKKDKEPRGRLLWYRIEELQQLLTHTSGAWETVVLLGARAGLRPGEIQWLEWQDVDFERNRLHVVNKPGHHIKDYENRWVPMSADLAANLKSAKRKGHWVISLDGDRIKDWKFWFYFREILKNAKLAGSRYTLRHTFASHLASAGVPLGYIAELMGHASERVTEIYKHLLPDNKDHMILKLPPLEQRTEQPPTVKQVPAYHIATEGKTPIGG